MEQKKKLLMKNYLSNLKITMGEAGYIKVWPEWRDMDYTPQYNKFYLICSGEGWIRIGDKEYYPKPGQMFLMPQGVKQSYSTLNENTFTKYWCHFNAKIGDANLFDVIMLPSFININDMSVPEGYFKKLIESNSSQEFTSSLKINAAILELISYFIDNSVVERINITSSQTVEKLGFIVDYIENNLRESITVEKLAKMVHLHPNYFIRIFKKHFGSSPINYITQKRVEAVKRLLETTDCTLGQAAEQVGVKDVYYMSKLFKGYTGYSATEYKKIIKHI
ncbi:MAG: AraC family transcriptional regulator [Clostridia bacterium]|nr:AraC family transcriptional regulator [Clostridia bacterium]